MSNIYNINSFVAPNIHSHNNISKTVQSTDPIGSSTEARSVAMSEHDLMRYLLKTIGSPIDVQSLEKVLCERPEVFSQKIREVKRGNGKNTVLSIIHKKIEEKTDEMFSVRLYLKGRASSKRTLTAMEKNIFSLISVTASPSTQIEAKGLPKRTIVMPKIADTVYLEYLHGLFVHTDGTEDFTKEDIADALKMLYVSIVHKENRDAIEKKVVAFLQHPVSYFKDPTASMQDIILATIVRAMSGKDGDFVAAGKVPFSRLLSLAHTKHHVGISLSESEFALFKIQGMLNNILSPKSK